MPIAPGVAVVATDVAHADRRALSEAWYAALHLSRDEPAPIAPRRSAQPPPAASPAPAGRHSASIGAPPISRAAAPGHPHGAARVARTGDPPPLERRSAASRDARRVARVLERIAVAPRRAQAQTIALDGRRVTLLVRSDARATRIVAVCSEALRPTVERALAHARFALVRAR